MELLIQQAMGSVATLSIIAVRMLLLGVWGHTPWRILENKCSVNSMRELLCAIIITL